MSGNFNMEEYTEDKAMDNTIKNYNKETGTMKSNINVTDMQSGVTQNDDKEAETMNKTKEEKNNKETSDMTTGINETPDNKWNGIAVSNVLANISKIIPEEETAVSEEKPSEDICELSVVEAIRPWGSADLQVPENERAEIDEESFVDLKESTKRGCFSPAVGMMGFKVNTGHRFYAKIVTDSKGIRWIEYCQQYKDGSYSAKMKVKQAELVTATMYLVNEMNGGKETSKYLPKNAVNKIIMNARNDYLNTIAFPQECVRIEQILLLLLKVYKLLPVEKAVSDEYDSPAKLYADVMAAIKKNPMWFSYDSHKAYYALEPDQLDIITEALQMKRDLLLKKLKEYNFLYLTDSSKGYQTCVRFPKDEGDEFHQESYTKWCYCIWKLEYLASQLEMKGQE